MLKDSDKLKLNKHLLKRFEPDFDDSGVIFLFNVRTDALWIGNGSAYDVINLIDGKRTLKLIYEKLMPFFKEYSFDEVKQSCNQTILDLLEKGFVEYA